LKNPNQNSFLKKSGGGATWGKKVDPISEAEGIRILVNVANIEGKIPNRGVNQKSPNNVS